jgi:transcriptional regulator with XRE-family HTH domain
MQPDIIGRRIKRLRRAREMTQKQLADAAEIPQSLVSQIESGTRRGMAIQVEVARRLAFALHVSLDALAGLPVDEESERFAAAAP